MSTSPAGHLTPAENTAKVARRRANAKAAADSGAAADRPTTATIVAGVKPQHRDHLLPDRPLDLTGVEVEHIGQVLAGVQDFKILRGTVVVLSLTTSTDFRHVIADASIISRGNVLVCDLYSIPRRVVFGDDEAGDATE